nr:uncharacterized protein LOC124815087 [Hydra vulgaris]
MSGRRSNSVWSKFEKLETKSGKGCKARCRICKKELQGLVARMKVHLNKCCHENNTEEIEFQTTSSNIQFDVTKQPSESSVLAEKCYLNVSAKKSRTENINNNINK